MGRGYYDDTNASKPLVGSRPAVDAHDSAAPSVRPRVGGYELCAKIADGGMASVYVARRVEGPNAGEVVAIKRIRDEFARNREFVGMFLD